MKIQQGDLIYIPQDVDLWNFEDAGGLHHFKTKKPTTAVFLGMDAFNTCRIFMSGRESSVSVKCVYPMEDRC